MDSERKVLIVGRLDGLVLTPILDGNVIKFIDFNVDTLPGLRLTVEFEAAVELRDALSFILKGEPCIHPCGDVTCGPAGGGCKRGKPR